MRLFVAVRPPVEVLDALDALPRPTATGVRWTTREQWHVTLRFFGNVDDPAPIVEALSNALYGARAVDATIGPRAAMLGKRVIHLPVGGLEDVATSIERATREFGDPPPQRQFHGHLTLARTKGASVAIAELALAHVWTVRAVELIRSHLHADGARYEALERFALGD